MKQLIADARNGRPRAIARLISLIENSEQAAQTAVTALYPNTGQAHIVGITGPPGAGKSSLVSELTKVWRSQEKQVAIVAVDPTSPFTGGALLGDRVRMRDLSGDTGVFIRSMASRGNLGGLAQATWAAVKVLDAAGFDLVLVETVGAGQAEVEIARLAHTTIVIEAPGMGDDVQAFKAGILEIADILVVNKADRPGSNQVVRALEGMLHLGPLGGTRHHGRLLDTAVVPTAPEMAEQWQIVVQPTVATEGKGLPALAERIGQHWHYLKTTGEWHRRERERSWQEIVQLLQGRWLKQLDTAVASTQDTLLTAVVQRQLDPYTAVEQLFHTISN